MSGEEFHVFTTSDESRRRIDRLIRRSRTVAQPNLKPLVQDGFSQISGDQVREYLLRTPPAEHTLIGPLYATASLPDDDHAGWHWKCSCGVQASAWIQNWPESEDEAREEWMLHFE